MSFEPFTRVALKQDFPEHRLIRGDVATVVEQHQGAPGQETGYSLEVFNAIGETIAVLVVAESQVEPLFDDEVLHVRQLEMVEA